MIESSADIIIMIITGWFVLSIVCVWLLCGIFKLNKKEKELYGDQQDL